VVRGAEILQDQRPPVGVVVVEQDRARRRRAAAGAEVARQFAEEDDVVIMLARADAVLTGLVAEPDGEPGGEALRTGSTWNDSDAFMAGRDSHLAKPEQRH
jgi:hypothetical protein